MASLADVSDASFEEEVLGCPGPVLVDFWAEWCGPCRQLEAVLEELADELAGRLRVVRLDVAANPRTPARYGVLHIPLLVLYRGGRAVKRFGSMSKDRLRRKLGEWV